MISPPRPDGPPIRFGKSYSTLAHLAENIRPFVAIDKGLRAEGFSAPEIYAVDLDVGVAVLEDFGSESSIATAGSSLERYAEVRRASGTAASDDFAGEPARRRIERLPLSRLMISMRFRSKSSCCSIGMRRISPRPH